METTQKEVKDKSKAKATAIRLERILVMDDDPVIGDLAGELISALGHNVEFATEGEEATRYTSRLDMQIKHWIL